MRSLGRIFGLAIITLVGLVITSCAQSSPAEPAGQEPQSSSEERTVYIGPVMVDCEGEGPQKCMLVRESPADEYSLFYDQIEGFEFEEGYEYELVVRVTQVQDPPAGGSSLAWSLVSVESKEPVPVAPQGEVKSIYVGPKLVDCVGVAPQKCLQVKEKPEDEYTLFYGSIEGFDYQEGYEYELLVQEEAVENPPADAPDFRWILVSEISKEPAGEQSTGQLEGVLWELKEITNQEGSLVETLSGTKVTARFEAGQVNGSAGCNNYFGGYSTEGNQIKFDMLASTEMFCGNPPGVMDQETAFLAAMGNAAQYVIEDNQLIFLDADDKKLMIFESAEAVNLPGSLWKVLMYNNGKQAVVSVLQGSEMSAYFSEDGRLVGSAGCNNYSADYQVDGESITIGPAVSTRMACRDPEGIMDQEMAYLAALEKASTYSFEGDRLILLDAGGSRLVDYLPARTFALSETVWHLQEFIMANGTVSSVLEGSEITAIFGEENVVSGNAGCNQYSGSYQSSENQLDVELGPLTMMFCDQPEGIMDQETAYLQALDSVASYHIIGDRLELQDEAGQAVLNFKASDLVGYVWMWQEFLENDGTVTIPDMPGNYTLEFLPDGQISLQADCNRAGGTYTAEGNQLNIEIMQTTLAACPEESLADRYLQLLNDAVAFTRQGDLLFIDIMLDSGTMKFFPLE